MRAPPTKKSFFCVIHALVSRACSLRAFFACALLFLGSFAWSTIYGYNNGTWYEYYDTTETDYELISTDTTSSHWIVTSAPYDFTQSGTIEADDVIIVSASSTLTLENGWINNGTIVCAGTVTIKGGSGITNNGTITVTSTGTLNLPNGGSNSGSITNSGTFTVNSNFTNSGTITNTRDAIFNNGLTNGDGAVITNTGTLTVSNGNLNNNGTVINTGTIDGTGSVSGGTVIDSNATHGTGNVYNWAGSAGDGLWTTPINWKDDDGNYFFDSYPGSADDDTAVFVSAVSVAAFTAAGSINVQIASGITITVTSIEHGSERIVQKGGTFQLSAEAGSTIGDISVTENGQLRPRTASLVIDGDLSIESSSSAYLVNSLTVTGALSNAGEITQSGSGYTYKFTGAVTNTGSIANGTCTLILGDEAADTLTNSGTIELGAGSTTFGGTLTNSGTITLSSGTATFNAAVTNTGSAEINCDTGAVTFAKTFTNTESATFNAADSTSGSAVFNGTVTNDAIFDCQKSFVTFNAAVTNSADAMFIASSSDTLFFASADFSAMSDDNFSANSGTLHFFTLPGATGGITLATCSGQTFNRLRFGGNVTIDTSAGNITVANLLMAAYDDYTASEYQTESFTASITGGNTVAVSTQMQLTRVSATYGVIGTCMLESNVTYTGTNDFVMNSGTALVIASGCTFTTPTFVTYESEYYSYALYVAGTLSASSATLYLRYTDVLCKGKITAAAITCSGTHSTSPTYNAATLSSVNTQGYAGTGHIFYNTGTVTVTGAITETADITNTGTMTAAGITANSITNSGSITSTAAVTADTIENTKTLLVTGSITATTLKNSTSAGKITLMGGTSALSFGTYTGDGADQILTYGNAITSTSAFSATIGTLTIAGSTTCSGLTDLTVAQSLLVYYTFTVTGGSLTVNGTDGAYTYLNAAVTTGGAQTYNGTVTVGGNATLVSDGTLSFSDVEISSGNTLAFGSGSSDAYTVTVSGSWENNGTLTANESTVTFTGDGKTVSGSSAFYNATFEASVTLSGANTYSNDFICEAGGSELSVSDTQAVAGYLILKGENGALLSLSGAGKFTAAVSKFSGEYLSLDSSIQIWVKAASAVSPGAFLVSESAGADTSATYAALFANGWKLDEVDFVWTGAVSTAWANAANWDVGIVPGDADGNTVGAVVTIPDGVASGNYPVTEKQYSLATLTIGTESASLHTARITLAADSMLLTGIVASSEPAFTNYATVCFTGAGRLFDGFNSLNDCENGGWVEYAGSASTLTDFASADGIDYANLRIKSAVSFSQGIIVQGELVVESGGAIDSTGSDADPKSLSVQGNATIAGAIGSTAPLVEISIGGETALSADVTTSLRQRYIGPVTLTGDADLHGGDSGSLVRFESTVDGGASLSVSADYVYVCGVIGSTEPLSAFSCTILHDNSADYSDDREYMLTLYGASVTTSGEQSYQGDVALYGAYVDGDASNTAATIALTSTEGSISFAKDVYNDGHASADNHTLTVNASDTVSFNQTVGVATKPLEALSVTAPSINLHGSALKTRGAQSYSGAVSTGTADLSLTTTETATGAIGIDGALSLSGALVVTTADSALTVTGAVTNESAQSLTVDAGSAAVHFSLAIGTDEKPLGALSFSGSGDVHFGGDVHGESIAVSGTTTAACSEIATSGNQSYDGSVTLTSACAFDSSGGSLQFQTVQAQSACDFTARAPASSGAISIAENIGSASSGMGAILLASPSITLEEHCGAVYSASGKTQVYDGSLTLLGETAFSGDVTVSGNGTFTAFSGTTRFLGDVDISETTLDANGGTVSFSASAAQTLVTKADASTAFNAFVIESAATLTTAASFTIAADFTNSGTFTASGGTITYTGASAVIAAGEDAAKTSFAAVEFAGALQIASGNASYAEATVSTPSVSVTFSGSNSFGTFSESGADCIIFFSGDNAFDTLSCTGAGTIVKFGAEKTQAVTTALISRGTALKPITLTTAAAGSADDEATWWLLDMPSAVGTALTESDFTYTNVEYTRSVNDIAHDWGATVTETAGTTAKWFLHTFYWIGLQNADWQTAGNWSYYESGTPAALSAPPLSSSYDEIVISTAAGGTTLVLSDAVSLKAITVQAEKTLDVADKAVSVSQLITNDGTILSSGSTLSASRIVNNGTLSLSGSETITAAMENGDESTVCYTGASLSALPWDGDSAASGAQYTNLVFKDAAHGSVSDALFVSASLSFEGGSVTLLQDAQAASVTVETGAVFALGESADAALMLTVSGNWTNNAGASGFVSHASTVCFTGDNALISGDNAFAELVLTGSAQTLNGSNSIETLTASGENAVFSGENVFGSATFTKSATLSASNAYTTFVADATDGAFTLTFGSGKTQSIASGGSFTVAGSASYAVTLSAAATTEQAEYWLLDANPANVAVSVSYAVVSYAKSQYEIVAYVANSGEGVESTTINWFNGVAPYFLLTLAPVGGNGLYVVFGNALGYAGSMLTEANFAANGAKEALEGAFDFVSASDGAAGTSYEALSVDAVQLVTNNAEKNFCVLRLSLNATVTLTHIRTLCLRVKTNAVQNENRTALAAGSLHCFSDFALNAVEVLYALSQGSEQAKAVRDFTASAGERLLSGRDILVQARLTEDGASAPGGNEKIRLLADTTAAVSDDERSASYNRRTDSFWRVWLPAVLKSLCASAHTPTVLCEAESADGGKGIVWNFALPNAPESADSIGWDSRDTVEFFFQVLDSADSPIELQYAGFNSAETVPLYALSMTVDGSALPFVDLWSFGFTDMQTQRGGVTILNNVIDVNAREVTRIEVDMPSDGVLSVYVLSADGNIVKRLSHGRVSGGNHYYEWDGTNGRGKPVARGIYFIRVTGSGIDETRKVMCVKN